jgi:hypothetical protein
MTNRPKSKVGRPRRHRPSENWIKKMVRLWIPLALEGAAPVSNAVPAVTKEEVLAVLRGRTDDFTIADEAYRFLAAQAKQDGRRVKRDDVIQRIAKWLEMDAEKLTNWLNRSKRRR